MINKYWKIPIKWNKRQFLCDQQENQNGNFIRFKFDKFLFFFFQLEFMIGI